MGYWPRASRKEIEALLGEFNAAEWSIKKTARYYNVRCPERCGDHQRWIHLTPSNPKYVNETLSWLYRQPCYEGSTS